MKRFFYVFVAMMLISAIVVTGCTQEAASEETEEPSEEVSTEEPVVEKEFKVGLLMDGPINDQGWNATAYSGLMQIEEDLGATVSYSESVPQSDVEEVFRSYALQGYDLVIGHGFNFIDGAISVSRDFPDTTFICSSCVVNEPPNMGSVTEDGPMKGFMAGVVAATLTETDHVAFIGGMEIPPIILGGTGFEAGARYINPDLEVTLVYTGSFVDGAKAKEIAYSLNDENVDITYVMADIAGFGAMEAAQDTGMMIIGTNTDQNELAPDTIVTSTTVDYPLAFSLVAQEVKDGTWVVSSKLYGFADTVLDLAPYHGFEDKISAEDKAAINAVKADIISRKIDVQQVMLDLGL